MTVEAIRGAEGVATPVRRRVYDALHPRGRLTATSRFLIAAILAATLLAILDTEPLLTEGRERWFAAAELGFALIFSVEFAARLWAAPESGMTRLRWLRTPTAIVDLVAILATLLPFLGANAMLLRMLRVMRMLRIARLGRFAMAIGIMERAIRSRASHLSVALILAILFLIVAATIIYIAEGEAQPDKFGSIPRSLWWTAVTMTTVGYGDVVPVTVFGKVLAGLISMGGIVLIAIPTGIMAAAFSDHMVEAERARAEICAPCEEAEGAPAAVPAGGTDPVKNA